MPAGILTSTMRPPGSATRVPPPKAAVSSCTIARGDRIRAAARRGPATFGSGAEKIGEDVGGI